MSTAAEARLFSRRWLVAIAVMSSAIMEVLDTSVVNVSLPHIAGSLSSTVDEATWVLTSYIVANAIILPITGWLSNYFGRKRLLITVVTGFTLSSVLCGLAPSLPFLIFFRVVQGITGGGLQPLSQSVMLEEFPGRERGKAMAFWSLGIIAAPVLGPTLGGWITDNYSWRWVFYINLPIGILSLILISLFVYDPSYIKRGAMRFDAWGMGILAIGMGALQIMLDKGQEDDWLSSRFIKTLAITAAVMLTAFIFRELKTPQPLVKLSLFRHRSFAVGIVITTVLGFVLYGSLVSLPLFMQELLGWTAETAGLWTSPRGIATAVCMPVVGYLLGKRWDYRWMVVLGCLIGSMAFFGYARNGPKLWDLGHSGAPDQSRHRSNLHIPAIDHTYHGPDSEGRYTLRHQPVQRDAQYWVQHGNILRDHLAGSPVAVPSGPSCRQHFALQSAVAAGAEPSRGNVRTARLRRGDLHAPGSWIPVWLVTTASHIAQLHRRVSCDGMAVPADRPFGAADAEAEA
jgi:EmrB/QacA subfamily drug resistance transporter